ncbi:MAG: DUF2846 domain-containing protein [Bacteroidetes bacterium]|nr:DUF2846 domain-containing protein [Bacteroidota bacterium]
MKTLAKITFLLVVVSFMGGCASGPTYLEMAPSIRELPQDTGRVYFYRTSALGAALQPEVKMNNEVVGKATAQGFFYADKEPGKYEIMTSTEVDRKLSFLLEAGQTRYVRFGVSMGFFVGHVYPELVSTEEGQEEIKKCKFIGNTMENN